MAELERELVEAQSKSVGAILARGGDELFPTHFGLFKADFDYIFETAKVDLEGMARVFAQRPAGAKTTAEPLGIDLHDVLKTKSENWILKIFDSACGALSRDDSQFSKAFLRRQTPAEVWEYTKDKHPEWWIFCENT